LSDYQNLSFENQSPILQLFLSGNASLPVFYDKKKLIRSTDFYRGNQQNIALILGLYSLPYCYLGADGAKVLYMSERIKNDTYRRLTETGSFLKAVMNYDNWKRRRDEWIAKYKAWFNNIDHDYKLCFKALYEIHIITLPPWIEFL
jgi:hypothetical protein